MQLKELANTISEGNGHRIVRDFPNGEIVGFQDLDNNCIIYRIAYIDTKETGDYYNDWQMKQPIETEVVACGLVAYYLHFPNMDFKLLFENYYSTHWRMFMDDKKQDQQANFDFLMEEEDEQKAEFHNLHIIQEKRNAEISKALFPYLEASTDTTFLNKLVQEYLKWLGEKVKPTDNETSFVPLSDDLSNYLHGMKNSMLNEEIIEQMDFNEFVNAIYSADFRNMYNTAKATRNKKRLFLLISRIKTWFPPEWEQQAAMSMDIEVKTMRKFSIEEIKSAHKAWCRKLDDTFPKYNSTQ